MGTQTYQEKLAEDIIKGAEKIIKTDRMYSGKHPQLDNFKSELYRLFGNYFGAFGDLILNVFPGIYSLGETKIFEDENVSGSNVYALYKSGVRNIAFMPNLTIPELAKFLKILSSHQATKSSNLITKLWEADFKSIKYHKIETFFEAREENDVSFSQFSGWLKRKNITMSKGAGGNIFGNMIQFGAISVSEKDSEKEYLLDEVKKDITIEDNIKLFEKTEEKEHVNLDKDDLSYINNQLSFDKKESVQRWIDMIIELSTYFVDFNTHQQYIEYSFKYIEDFIRNQNYKPLFMLFYGLKISYETSTKKEKTIELVKSFYKDLLMPERIDKLIEHLSDLNEENYIDFKLFLGQLNKVALSRIVDNFARIQNKEIRTQLINFLKGLNYDLTNYYINALKLNDSAVVLEAIDYINNSNLPLEQKIAYFKSIMDSEDTDVVLKLFTIFNGYYDNDLSMFILKHLKGKNQLILRQILIYLDHLKNDQMLLKALKFIETEHFFEWQLQQKKDYLAILTYKIGFPIKNYLMVFFDDKQAKSKKGFDEVRLAIVYALAFLIDRDVINFLQTLSGKLLMSKDIKQEALLSLQRMKKNG